VTDQEFDRAAKTDSAKYSALDPKTAQSTAQHGARTKRKNPGNSGVFSGFFGFF
jgi:hypothetical protein